MLLNFDNTGVFFVSLQFIKLFILSITTFCITFQHESIITTHLLIVIYLSIFIDLFFTTFFEYTNKHYSNLIISLLLISCLFTSWFGLYYDIPFNYFNILKHPVSILFIYMRLQLDLSLIFSSFVLIYYSKQNEIIDINYFEFEYYDLKYDQTKCTICLDDFVKNDKLGELKCLHIYHEICIHEWFRKCEKTKKCPICFTIVNYKNLNKNIN